MNLRDYERASIRAFVQRAADEGYLSGRVLDYGCGRQPYRDIVEAAGGEYHGFDRAEFRGALAGVGDVGDEALMVSRGFAAILCTQVIQYDREPSGVLSNLREHTIATGGYLILTYPTSWPEVEADDLHRFTKAGMALMLADTGWTVLRHERRAYVFGAAFDIAPGKIMRTEDEFTLGYGVVAKA